MVGLDTLKMFFVCSLGIITLLLPAAVVDASQFNNNPGTVSIHENYDGTHTMWSSISATCYVSYTRYYYCSTRRTYDCGFWGWSICSYYEQKICSSTAYINVGCNQCYLNNNPSGHFQMSGFTVQKKSCTNPYCGPTCSNAGCLNGGDSHSVGVTCYNDGGNYLTNGAVSTSFTVSVYNANSPTFYYSGGSSISVSHDDYGVGGVINIIVASTDDDGNDYDYPRYRQNSGPETSYLLGTSDLFYLDTSNGYVKVGKDLTMEFSYYFKMNLCVYDRRNREVCHDLKITLWACFQTPTCDDQQELSVHDTFGTYTGHGGSTNVIFEMEYDAPSGHFTDFSTVWHDLTWSFDNNEFPETTINSDSGDIYITRNISIWPAWPTKDYNQVVLVSNSESCYTTTCSFLVRVHYTNWPIEFRSLPASTSMHEDWDYVTMIHNIIVFDYNYYWEDNVTCNIVTWYPREDDMFELRHDGNNAYNSYKLYKLRCQDPNCGYKYNTRPQPWYCETDIGCLTYNRTQQYTVTLYCEDGYNTSVQEDFTFNVLKNQVPVYRHLPTHIDLEALTLSHYDTIFEIMYRDSENENLIYEYDYKDSSNLDTKYFYGTPNGNYYNNLANITMTTFSAGMIVNESFTITVCAHERRNEICEDLTIDIEEYCHTTPNCYDDTFYTDTEFAIGDELFDLSALTYGGTFNSLSYSINSAQGSLFSLDSSTGKVTTVALFPEVFPSTSYSIIGYVYNTGSCSYGSCQLIVNVTAINYAIVITNLPATEYTHEDTTESETIFTVGTSDANTADNVTCVITNSADVEPFYLDRTPPVSGDFVVKNRQNGVLSSATTTYSVSITCTDSHGESDSGVLTIEINLNQAPTFTDFATGTTNVNADPMDYSSGDNFRTISASDTENDDLTFTCLINASNIPFVCEAGATSVHVKLSRDLRIDDENGVTYAITICLRDAKHSDQCGDLVVTFTRVKSRPEITNLPASVSFTEETALGTVLFTPVIIDLDSGESHTVSMTVSPSSATSAFSLDTSTGSLTLRTSLDFEQETSYMFTYSVRDEYLEGETEKTLKLAVTNVNEGNTITATTTAITFSEDTAANTELTDPGLSCSDIDGDTTSFAIESGTHSSYFRIDSSSGRITLTQEWDLESTLPSSTSLSISCSDGALSSSTVITFNIESVNDNRPAISIVTGTSPISINPSTSLYTDLMTFDASDNDFGDDGNFDYSILGSGLGATYFRMLHVVGTTQAKLRLKATPPFINDKTFVITVKVSDGESVPLFSGITVTINFTRGDPDAKSKQTTKCVTCTSTGRGVIAAFAVEAVIVLACAIHIMSNFCSGSSTGVHLIRKIPKVRLPKTHGPRTRNIPNKKSNNIEMNERQSDRKQESNSDSNDSSSSSSSDSSDEDDKIKSMRVRSVRPDVGHRKFLPQYASSMSPSQPFPQPLYASSINAPGSIMENEL